LRSEVLLVLLAVAPEKEPPAPRAAKGPSEVQLRAIFAVLLRADETGFNLGLRHGEAAQRALHHLDIRLFELHQFEYIANLTVLKPEAFPRRQKLSAIGSEKVELAQDDIKEPRRRYR
jgi:hypothetical protein